MEKPGRSETGHPGSHLPELSASSPIEGWNLVERVAQSELAETYRARPAVASKDRPGAYALKLLRSQWEADPRARELFRRELLLGRLVRHPHLVAVLGGHVHQPPIYLITPWLEGQTLAKCLAQGWCPELPLALWIVRQTAEALDALHRAGWMHGDVKPENIHLSPGGHVTLLDLGFARRPKESTTALDRCVVGTCAYLAPEAVSSHYRPDIRSDLYSLGVVLFQILCQRLPFEADSPSEMIAVHRQVRAPDVRRLAPETPRSVAQLVQCLLAKEPLRRPQTPEELIDRLVRLEIKTFVHRCWPLANPSALPILAPTYLGGVGGIQSKLSSHEGVPLNPPGPVAKQAGGG